MVLSLWQKRKLSFTVGEAKRTGIAGGHAWEMKAVRWAIIGILAAIMVGGEAAAWGQSTTSRSRTSHLSCSKKKNAVEPDDEPPCPHPWPKLSDAQQEAAVKRRKLSSTNCRASSRCRRSLMPKRVTSCLPPICLRPHVTPVLPYLDSMYNGLCDAFGLDRKANLWNGKAVVLAFSRREMFVAFESTFYHDSNPLRKACRTCMETVRCGSPAITGIVPVSSPW